jgi:predicted RNA-binding protein YlxR (DUF448 family)
VPQTESRHTPRRTCVGCRAVDDQRELVRFARDRAGVLIFARAAPGRGAYVHRTRACLERALQAGAVQRALRSNVRLSQSEAWPATKSVDAKVVERLWLALETTRGV